MPNISTCNVTCCKVKSCDITPHHRRSEIAICVSQCTEQLTECSEIDRSTYAFAVEAATLISLPAEHVCGSFFFGLGICTEGHMFARTTSTQRQQLSFLFIEHKNARECVDVWRVELCRFSYQARDDMRMPPILKPAERWQQVLHCANCRHHHNSTSRTRCSVQWKFNDTLNNTICCPVLSPTRCKVEVTTQLPIRCWGWKRMTGTGSHFASQL